VAADPTETYVAPKAEAPVPYLNFAPLDNALVKLEQSASTYTQARNATQFSVSSLPAAQVSNLNQILYQAERYLTSPQGLPRRSWYRHHIYAPGFYTGYGVKTLPGVREAIEERAWDEAQAQIDILANILNQFSGQIDRATELLSPATNRAGQP
jgi:N-acetylated-alpha-linked acidic dipeptidase